MTTIHPVILCGGSGTRLWPRSRKSRPKPFLKLLGERTLFQQSLDRVSDQAMFAPPTIVAGAAHVSHIEEQMADRDDATVIVEPAAKNTAPAIALAAGSLPEDAIMLVCPSDHHIADEAAFVDGVERAGELAGAGWLVSLGVEPTAPETGYGYIKRGGEELRGNRTEQFVEKPDRERAEQFIADGGYVWNAGIFAFRAGAFLAELARHCSEMAELVEASVSGAEREGSHIRPDSGPFAKIEGESIDYAVMENTDRAAVVAADMGWSDIGNWQALMAAREADGDGNVISGATELLGCRDVMVESDGPRVSVVGAEGIIVVVDGDEVLVTTADGAQQVGKLSGASGQ